MLRTLAVVLLAAWPSALRADSHCGAGSVYYSSTCNPCPVGYYCTSNEDQGYVVFCPSGTATITQASTNSSSCVTATAMNSACSKSMSWSASSCGAVIQFSASQSQLFSTPNPYNVNTNYYTAIAPPAGHRLKVLFGMFGVESSGSGGTVYDAVAIYSSTSGITFRTLTSTLPSASVMPWCNGQFPSCATGAKYGIYGVGIIVQLYSNSNTVGYGISFTVTADPCPAGSYCPSGASTQNFCPANSYCPSGSMSPIRCPPGFNSSIRSRSIADCTFAALCPVGSWNSTGNEPCAMCAANTWTFSTGSTACVSAIPMSICPNTMEWDTTGACGPLLSFSSLASSLFFTPRPFAFDSNYYTAVQPTPGYRLALQFFAFSTEDISGVGGDPVIITTTTGPFMTLSSPDPLPGRLFMDKCAGLLFPSCAAGTKFGDYGSPLVIQLFSDSYNNISGVTFSLTQDACPEGSYCANGVSTPTLCPEFFYCPRASVAPLDCSCCATNGSAYFQSCSQTPSPTPSTTPSNTPSGTRSPTPSESSSVTPSVTASRTPSQTPSMTRSPTPSSSLGVGLTSGSVSTSLVSGVSYTCLPVSVSCLVTLSVRGGDGGNGSVSTSASVGGLGACFTVSLALDSTLSSFSVSIGKGGTKSANPFSSGGGGGASAVIGDGAAVIAVAGGGGGGGGDATTGFSSYGGNASLPGAPAFNGGSGSSIAVGGFGASLVGPGAGANTGNIGVGGAGGKQCASLSLVPGGTTSGSLSVRMGGDGQDCSANNVKGVGGGGGGGYFGGGGGWASANFGGGGGGGSSFIDGLRAVLKNTTCLPSTPVNDGSIIVLSVATTSPSATPSRSPTPTPTQSLPPTPPPRPSNAPASFASYSTASGARNLSDSVFPPDATIVLNDNNIGVSQIVVRAFPCTSQLSLCWSPDRLKCGKPTTLEGTYTSATCTLTRAALVPSKFTAAEATSILRTLSFSATTPMDISFSLSLTNAICSSNGPCVYPKFVADVPLGCSTNVSLFTATDMDLYRPRDAENGCFPSPSVISEVSIDSPAFYILPNSLPAITITEGAAPTALWPDFLSSWIPPSTPRTIYSVRIMIVSGCTGADMLYLMPGSGLSALPPPLSVVSLASSTGCPADIELRGATALGFVNLAMRQVKMSSSSLNAAPSSLFRVIRVDIDDFATAFTTVAVASVNDAVTSSSPSFAVNISEGLPDFGVVVRQTCDGTGRDTLFGLPVICLTDVDPPFVRAAPVSDTYVGARGVGTETSSTYTMLFDDPSCSTCTPACKVNAAIVPVGAPVYDCSQAQPKNVTLSQPIACVFQRFRLLVGRSRVDSAATLRAGSGYLPAGSNTSLFSLDAQAAYCEPRLSASHALATDGLSFTTVLLITDAFLGTPSISKKISGITLSLVSGDDVPVVAFPDSTMASKLGAPLPPSSPVIFIDDATGNSSGAIFVLCSQVSPSTASWGVPTRVLEGSGARPLTAPWNKTVVDAPDSLFVATALSPATRMLLSDAKPCAAAFDSTSNAVAATGANVAEIAWTWVQNFTLQSALGVGVLSALRTRVLTVSVSAAGGMPLIIPVTVTRKNSPVLWAQSPTQFAVSEHFAGAFSPDLNISDADSAQDVSFRVVRATPISCANSSGGGAADCRFSTAKSSLNWASAFSVAAVPRKAAVVDASTGLTSFVNATRAARLSVTSALDTTEMACFLNSAIATWPSRCTVDVTLEARDAANVSATQVMMPSARITSSFKTVSVFVDSAIAPSISFVEFPSGGFSVRGGDAFFVNGVNLSPGVGGVFNASLVVVGDVDVTFPVTCDVVRDLIRLRCVSTAGWGVVTLHLIVGGRLVTYDPLNYRAASVLALAANPQSPTTWSLSLNSTADALTRASTAMPAFFDDALAGIVRGTFAPAPTIFSALVIDVPPVAALNKRKRCISFTAGIALENGTVLPINNCVRDMTPVSPSVINLPAFSAIVALNDSVSWVTCPVFFSAGIFRRIAVSASIAECGGGDVPSPALFSAAIKRRTPSITGISQPATNSSFTIVGVNFGSGAVADDGDVVEYAAVKSDGSPVPACVPPPSTPLEIANAGVSCAVHRAVGCFYAYPNTHVTCDVDPDAWGAGYRVRVVVRGAVSAWSNSTISHGRPRLISVRPVAIPGALNDSFVNVTYDKALEGAGGGLLLLRGENLWPPNALVIIVGGVRVYAIDAKPLAGGERYAPAACYDRYPPSASLTPSASPTATMTATPSSTPTQSLWTRTPTNTASPTPSPTQSQTWKVAATLPTNGPCFGDAGTRSRAARRAPPAFTNLTSANPPSAFESSILVIAPPGFGTISVRVSVGGLDPAVALVSYRDPSITGMELAGGAIDNPGDIEILVHGVSISPCIMCTPRSGNRNALNDGSVCKNTQLPASTLPAVQRALPANDTNEGTFPSPFLFGARFDNSSTQCILPDAPCLSDCALPDELWSMAKPTAPRVVTSFPDVDLTLEGVAVSPVANVYIVAADTGGADFTMKTALRSGTLSLITHSSISTAVTAVNFSFNAKSFSTFSPYISNIAPSIWSTEGGNEVKISVDSIGTMGYVILSPGVGNSTFSSAAERLWPYGSLVCPIIASTILHFSNEQTEDIPVSLIPTAPDTQSRSIAVLRSLGSDPGQQKWSYVEQNTQDGNPYCYVAEWFGSSIPRSGGLIRLVAPPFRGEVSVQVFSNGYKSSPVSVVYNDAEVCSECLDPMNGPTVGTSIGISAKDPSRGFGLNSTLGGMWNFLRPCAVSDVFEVPCLPAEDTAFPSSVSFFYTEAVDPCETKCEETSSIRRPCEILSWNNTYVKCAAPEGVPSSRNTIRMKFNSSSSGQGLYALENKVGYTVEPVSAQSKFTYDAPIFGTLVGPVFDADGLAEYTVSGANFGPTFPSTNTAPFPGRFWRPYARLRPVPDGGLVGGSAEMLHKDKLGQLQMRRLNQTSFTLSVPRNMEGKVYLALLYLGGASEAYYLQLDAPFDDTWQIVAPPPVIARVTTLSTGAFDDVDPCAFLNVATKDPAAACLADAFSVGKPALAPLDPLAPCVRATKSALDKLSLLVITAAKESFGSGQWSRGGVFVVPRSTGAFSYNSRSDLERLVAKSPQDAFECVPVPGLKVGGGVTRQSVWLDNSTIVCGIEATSVGLPVGPFDVIVGAAFAFTSSATSGVVPQAVCPCGMDADPYATGKDAICLPCVKGAVCAGGNLSAVSRPGFFGRTDPGWAERSLDVVALDVDRYVPCPYPDNCIGAGKCATGGYGWGCSYCKFSGNDLYERERDGSCRACSPFLSKLAVGLVVASPLIILFIYGAITVVLLRCFSISTDAVRASCVSRAQGVAAAAKALCVCSRQRTKERSSRYKDFQDFLSFVKSKEISDRGKPAIVPIFKIALAFFQTIASLTAYVTVSRLRRTVTGDLNLLPNFLSSISIVVNFGINSALFKCAAHFDYPDRLRFYMALPFVVLGLIPIVYRVGLSLINVFRRVHAFALGVPKPASLEYKFTDGVFFTLATFTTILPLTVGVLSKSQFCAPAREGGYLYEDPDVSCYKEPFKLDPNPESHPITQWGLMNHSKYVSYVYVFVVPGIIFCVFMFEKIRGATQSQRALSTSPNGSVINTFSQTYLKFLTEGYADFDMKAQFVSKLRRAWECVAMFRKLVLTGLSVGLFSSSSQEQDVRTQVTFSLFLLASMLILHLLVQPWKSAVLNELDTMSYSAALAMGISVGSRVQTFLSPGYAARPVEQTTFDLFALVSAGVFFFTWARHALDAAFFKGELDWHWRELWQSAARRPVETLRRELDRLTDPDALRALVPARAHAAKKETACALCARPATTVCSGCYATAYCDIACQRAHADLHKAVCASLRVEPEDSTDASHVEADHALLLKTLKVIRHVAELPLEDRRRQTCGFLRALRASARAWLTGATTKACMDARAPRELVRVLTFFSEDESLSYELRAQVFATLAALARGLVRGQCFSCESCARGGLLCIPRFIVQRLPSCRRRNPFVAAFVVPRLAEAIAHHLHDDTPGVLAALDAVVAIGRTGAGAVEELQSSIKLLRGIRFARDEFARAGEEYASSVDLADAALAAIHVPYDSIDDRILAAASRRDMTATPPPPTAAAAASRRDMTATPPPPTAAAATEPVAPTPRVSTPKISTTPSVSAEPLTPTPRVSTPSPSSTADTFSPPANENRAGFAPTSYAGHRQGGTRAVSSSMSAGAYGGSDDEQQSFIHDNPLHVRSPDAPRQ